MWRETARRLRCLLVHEDGQVAILVALTLTALMLTTGVIIDGGMRFFEERLARNAADAAALAGAKQIYDGFDNGAACSDYCSNPGLCVARPAFAAACTMAESYGYFDSDPNTEVRVNIPALSPPSELPAPPAGSVQAIVRQSRDTAFMRLAGVLTWTVGVHAVAGQQVGEPLGVLYALSDSACPGLDRAGSGNLGVFGGSILVNAGCSPPPRGAFDKSGTGQICVDDCDELDLHCESPVFSDCDGDGNIMIDGEANCPVSGCNSQPDLYACDHQGNTPDPLANLPGPDPDPDPEGGPVPRDPDGEGGYDPQYAFTFCDDNGDGTIDSAVPGALLLADPRTQASVVAGTTCGSQVITSSSLLGAGTATNPSLYDACTAPLIGTSHVISPGIYWGGIQAGNCDVTFRPGIYILAGRDNGNPPSLDLQMNPGGSATNESLLGGAGVLFFVTRDDDAPGNRRASGDVNFSTAGTGSINLSAGVPPTCPIEGPTYAGLFLFVHRGADVVPETTGPTNNNQTFINGGGAFTQFQGAFYDRYGRFRANGSFQLLDAEVIYNVLDFQIQGDVIVTAQCGGPGASFLLLLE